MPQCMMPDLLEAEFERLLVKTLISNRTITETSERNLAAYLPELEVLQFLTIIKENLHHNGDWVSTTTHI